MLEIRKKSVKHFRHYYGDFEPYSANDITIIFDGNNVRLRSVSGRVIFLKDGFNVTEVKIYDETDTGAIENFVTIESLVARLVQLGYPFLGNENEIIYAGTTFDTITGLPETNSNLVQYIIDQLTPLESDINDNSNDISNIENDITNINNDLDTIDTTLEGKLDSIQAGSNISIDNSDPNNPIISSTGGGGGGGDMYKIIYDPNEIEGDAFSMGNMNETPIEKIFKDVERSKLNGIEDGAQVNVPPKQEAITGTTIAAQVTTSTYNLDQSLASVWTLQLTEPITTFTFSNIPSTDENKMIVIETSGLTGTETIDLTAFDGIKDIDSADFEPDQINRITLFWVNGVIIKRYFITNLG